MNLYLCLGLTIVLEKKIKSILSNSFFLCVLFLHTPLCWLSCHGYENAANVNCMTWIRGKLKCKFKEIYIFNNL